MAVMRAFQLLSITRTTTKTISLLPSSPLLPSAAPSFIDNEFQQPVKYFSNLNNHNDPSSSLSPPFLAPSSRLNPGDISSILGTTPTQRGKRKAFQQIPKNKRDNKKPHLRKRYGWYKNEGMWVMEKHIIVNQRALNVYPGENVGVNPDKSLYALRAGNVLSSMEELNPYPDSPLYAAVENGERIMRLFIHVIPPPEPQTFKLVSLV